MTTDTNLELPPPDDGDRPDGSAAKEDSRPPLRRYDGILGGVAVGVAQYLRMAPWLVRLAFVVLSFFGGLGILLYLAGWVLIPAAGNSKSIAEGWLAELGTGRSWIGAALIALAAIWLLTSLDMARSGFAWAIALLVLGVLLYREEIPRESSTPQGTEDAEVGEAVEAGTKEAVISTRQPRTRREPRPRRVRPPSVLGRYILAAGLIGLGVLALLDNSGVLFPDVRHYLALALAIVGAGLLIGSVWGRSRVSIVVGLLLAFLMGVATIGEAVETFADEVRSYKPAAIEEVATIYKMDQGTLIVDLTQVDWQDQERDIEAELGAGQLIIRLPANVTATVNARAGAGQVEILGRSSEGLGVGRTARVEGPAGSGYITISVRVGAGQITVTRESTS